MTWSYFKSPAQRLGSAFLWILVILAFSALSAFIGVQVLDIFEEMVNP